MTFRATFLALFALFVANVAFGQGVTLRYLSPGALINNSTGTANVTVTVQYQNSSNQNGTVSCSVTEYNPVTGGVVGMISLGTSGPITPNNAATFTFSVSGNMMLIFQASAMGTTVYQTTDVALQDNIAPSVPTGLGIATPTTTNSLTAVWAPSSDNEFVSSYQVQLLNMSNALLTQQTTVGSNTSATFSGLQSGTSYQIRVLALDWAQNASNYCTAVTGTTASSPPPAPTTPGSITSTQVSGASTPSMTLSWGASTQTIGSPEYTVTITGGNFSQSYTVTTPQLTVTGLQAGQTYSASVVAVNTAGVQSGGAATLGFTAPATSGGGPGQPYGLAVSNVTATSMTVSWSSPLSGTAVNHYLITQNGGTAQNVGSASFCSFTTLTADTAYTYQVKAVDSSGNVSVPSAAFTVATTTPVTQLPSPTTITQPPTVGSFIGTLAAKTSVDMHGAGQITLPLKIAPGRGGLEPSLTLSYSSSQGNGPEGVGFSLSTGFPQAITRGRTLLARDGIVQGITFTDGVAGDKYYLDGKRLLCVGGSYGQPNSLYRTEVDSFGTLSASGAGAHIDTFVLTDTENRQFTFGKFNGTLDGFQLGGAEPNGLAYSYALKQVKDAWGNYVSFTYADLGNGEYVLSEIDYTGSNSANPGSSVKFTYVSRTDAPVTFIATRSFSHQALLAQIASYVGSQEVACYQLNYGLTQGTSVGYTNIAGNGNSHLLAVTPYLWDTNTAGLAVGNAINFQWQPNQRGVAPYSPSNFSVGSLGLPAVWGDFGDAYGNQTGLDTPQWFGDPTTATGSYIGSGDFFGSGVKSVVLAGIGGVTISGKYGVQLDTSVAFRDPNASTYIIANNEGPSALDRYCIGDFNGDGRDDIAVVGIDGYLYVWASTGTGFSAPTKSPNPVVQAAGIVFNYNEWWKTIGVYVSQNFDVRCIPCDLNGDGRSDIIIIQSLRNVVIDPNNSQRYSQYQNTRLVKAVLSIPTAGNAITFTPTPFVIDTLNYANGDIYPTNAPTNVQLNAVYAGILVGDFNGDGKTDVLTLGSAMNSTSNWTLWLSEGDNGSGGITFQKVLAPIPNTVTVNTSETANTYFKPITTTAWNSISAADSILTTSNAPVFSGIESGGGNINAFIYDVNGDGLPDYVWYVATQSNDQNSGAPGWYAMLSTGNFQGSGGFIGPVKLDFFNNQSGMTGWQPYGSQNSFSGLQITPMLDFNGDGHMDFVCRPTTNGKPSGGFLLQDNTGTFGEVISAVTDGLGRISVFNYKAAKDASIYTPGAAVAYPIREVRRASPAVSDLYLDNGGPVPSNLSLSNLTHFDHFGYQYSGDRLDLSGRGDLGFHSFITLDEQTQLFKYQFLTQSFPMTGLSAREQTYRYWTDSSGNADFKLQNSHDDTVIFDSVVQNGQVFGTVYPFVEQAVESRWEDSATADYVFSTTTALAHPEELFASYFNPPAHPYVTITTQSCYDGQTSLQPTPLAALPSTYSPSDIFGHANTVGGVDGITQTASVFQLLPGKISYGNLSKLYTNYGDGVTEEVDTTYNLPTLLNSGGYTLTGLQATVKTTVTSAAGTQIAPVKEYTYEPNTATVKTEATDAGYASPNGDSTLNLTTTYNHDTTGRLTSTSIAPTATSGTESNTSDPQYIAQHTTAQFSNPDAYDEPRSTLNSDPYRWATSIGYDMWERKSSETDVNNATTTISYDPLDRVVAQEDVLRGLQTTHTLSVDTSQPVNPPSNWVGVAPGAPISGVYADQVTSAYSDTVRETAKPTIVHYYDRLGREIRTIKSGFNGQLIYTDTAYNNLGQIIGTTLPYQYTGQNSVIYWTTTGYDALGRVAQVTAPNGTVTTTTYIGLAKQVSVSASSTSNEPSGRAQVTSSVVDARGRTVKVWNPDPTTSASPSFSDTVGTTTVSPSVQFTLDGFGQLTSTALAGQATPVAVGYDALGHKNSMNDPDLCPNTTTNWTYVTNALGDVVKQVDARGTITLSTFDNLRRPLTRTTTESAGPVETATWTYYDTADNVGPNTMARGAKGWVGSLAREAVSTTGAPGYPNAGTTTGHYYDFFGRPAINLSQIDGKWFYTCMGYDSFSRPTTVQHFWRPGSIAEANNQTNPTPTVWNSFGYVNTYDNQSYLLSVMETVPTRRAWWDSPTYDYMDRVTSARKGQGYTTSRTYNAADGKLTNITTYAGSITLQNLSYGYDGLGNLLTQGNGSNSEAFTYDILNRLKSSTIEGTVDYSPNGNIQDRVAVDGTSGTYSYDPNHIHAVYQAFNFTLGYDNDGNLTSRTGNSSAWSFNWNGTNHPRWVGRTSAPQNVALGGDEFQEDADHSRVIHLQFSQFSNNVPAGYIFKRIYAAGPDLEVEYNYSTSLYGASTPWGHSLVRAYVPAPDGIVGTDELTPIQGSTNVAERALIDHYDHLGSLAGVTVFGDKTGAFAPDKNSTPRTAVYNEDAWGQRRNPNTWTGAPATSGTLTSIGGPNDLTPKGFTGHEMLDDVGLVHMNGRIYDSLLGRFISADMEIQFAQDLQSYNRYSYVRNNPVSTLDPSGHSEIFEDPTLGTVTVAPTGYVTSISRGTPIEALALNANLAANNHDAAKVKMYSQQIGDEASRLGTAGLSPREVINGAFNPKAVDVFARAMVAGGASMSILAEGGATEASESPGASGNVRSGSLQEDLNTNSVKPGAADTVPDRPPADESTGSTLFANHAPNDEVGAPIQTFTTSQLQNKTGVFNYVVKEDGTLVVGRINNQAVGGGHIDLAGGGRVQAAGEVKVVQGQIKYIDNSSGHYLPSGSSAQAAAVNAFNNAGLNATGKYIEKVWNGSAWVAK